MSLAAGSCLNCDAPLAGPYCAHCGQPAVDLAEPTWRVVREAVAEAADVDGRLVRTARALLTPGELTAEYRRGRRAPYVGPFKVFLAAGAVLSTTWLLTRGVDARFYHIEPDTHAGAYIETVTRSMLVGALAFALGSWALARGRRRLVDEVVFGVHTVAALTLLAALAIWLGTAWKLAWGDVYRVPRAVPELAWILFAPAAAAGLVYVAGAVRRTYRSAWWAAVLRALALTAACVWLVGEVAARSTGR
jgi:hypothetical protein